LQLNDVSFNKLFPYLIEKGILKFNIPKHRYVCIICNKEFDYISEHNNNKNFNAIMHIKFTHPVDYIFIVNQAMKYEDITLW
jgi:hypothetical protein